MAGIIFSNSLKLCFVSEETKHYMVSGISHYEIKQYAHGCLDNGSQKREAALLRKRIIHFICYFSSGNKPFKALSLGRSLESAKNFILYFGSDSSWIPYYATKPREASNIRRLLNSVDFEHVVTEDCKYTDMDCYESIGFKILNTRRNRSNRA